MAVLDFDPNAVADRGRKIYDRYRRKLEAEHVGKIVVIDVPSERFFLGESPENAYRAARQANKDGPFHVVRVGEPGVYRSTRPGRWRRPPAR